jgi:hypothetical protein
MDPYISLQNLGPSAVVVLTVTTLGISTIFVRQMLYRVAVAAGIGLVFSFLIIYFSYRPKEDPDLPVLIWALYALGAVLLGQLVLELLRDVWKH